MVLLANVMVGFGLHEPFQARIDDVIDSRALPRHCQSGAIDCMIEKAGLHIGEFCSKAHPPVYRPIQVSFDMASNR